MGLQDIALPLVSRKVSRQRNKIRSEFRAIKTFSVFYGARVLEAHYSLFRSLSYCLLLDLP